MNSPKFVVAIDGLAASGKSAIALALSRHFSLERLDSGSFYRFVTFFFLERGIDWRKEDSLENGLRLLQFDYRPPDHFFEGKPVTPFLRSPQVERWVSEVSRIPRVREKVNQFIREYSSGKRMVVEGRDIGSVVFPRAQVKIFLTASEEVRAKRRALQNKKLNLPSSEEEARKTIKLRDSIDSTRPVAPAVPAPDALIIDTSSLDFEQVLKKVMEITKERLEECSQKY
ncbi:MAG: (d)CMP kinase [Caldiserica bacterium]|nr:(d)CMP kinase [Caldisericota bacterium]MDH7562859.1 (d)CMP kinase [Caldisericota bacterium]